jgi:hypothetical protein
MQSRMRDTNLSENMAPERSASCFGSGFLQIFSTFLDFRVK